MKVYALMNVQIREAGHAGGRHRTFQSIKSTIVVQVIAVYFQILKHTTRRKSMFADFAKQLIQTTSSVPIRQYFDCIISEDENIHQKT